MRSILRLLRRGTRRAQLDVEGAALQRIHENKPALDHVIHYDPDLVGMVPFYLNALDVPVEAYKDLLLHLHEVSGLGWTPFFVLVLGTVRLCFLPLLAFQMRHMGAMAPLMPGLLFSARCVKDSPLSRRAKAWLFLKGALQTLKSNKVNVLAMGVSTGAHLFFMLASILALRRVVSEPAVREVRVLWLEGMLRQDPLWLTPVLAVGMLYHSIGLGLTPATRGTLIGRIKGIGQVLVLLWLPFICYWPAGVTLFISLSAGFSVLQAHLSRKPWFQKRLLSQEQVIYFGLLHTYQLDPTLAEAVSRSLLSADERFPPLKEEQLLEETRLRVA